MTAMALFGEHEQSTDVHGHELSNLMAWRACLGTVEGLDDDHTAAAARADMRLVDWRWRGVTFAAASPRRTASD